MCGLQGDSGEPGGVGETGPEGQKVATKLWDFSLFFNGD